FLPAWGGTVRLPRLVGYSLALRLLLADLELGPEEALDGGLIDGVLPAEDGTHSQEARLLEIASSAGSRLRRRRSIRRRMFEDTAPGRRVLVAHAARAFRLEARSNVSARVLLRLIAATAGLPIE